MGNVPFLVLNLHSRGGACEDFLINFSLIKNSVFAANMSLIHSIYHGVAKRTSTFVLAIAVSAFAFERAFDVGTEAVWDNHNKGKLWKDIAHKYENKEEDDE